MKEPVGLKSNRRLHELIDWVYVMLLICVVAVIVGGAAYNPYHCNCYVIDIDMSLRNMRSNSDIISEWLVGGSINKIHKHQAYLDAWRKEQEKHIEFNLFRRIRLKQLNKAYNDSIYIFRVFTRVDGVKRISKTIPLTYKELVDWDKSLRVK